MKRRTFLMLLGGAALFPRIAIAQRPDGAPRVAVVEWDPADVVRKAPFVQALRELGYVEGQNIRIDYHYCDTRLDRADALAAEIVKSQVAVIVAFTTPVVHAVKKATATIPVISVSADPLGSGIVSNLARPGGNITGVSNMMPDLESKRLELLRELLPGLNRVGYLGSTRDPAARTFVREAQGAAARLSIRLDPHLIGTPDEIDGALARMAGDTVQAVIVQPLFALNADSSAKVAALAVRHRLPAISNYGHFARAGGLMTYGPDPDFGRRTAARYVDRILKGAVPGDLPIEQPVRFEFVLNLKTAGSLGINVPPLLAARAEEVIE